MTTIVGNGILTLFTQGGTHMSRATATGMPAMQPQSTMTKPTIPYERIAKLAYEKWMKSGCMHGCDQQNWLEAEAELMKMEMGKTCAMPMPAKR